MTHLDLAAAPQATTFAQMMESAATPHELEQYRGVLTPLALDAPIAESGALTTAVAAHDLGWLKRVAVRGEDRFRWLSGMVTNQVNGLEENSGAWSLVLNAQGRIQGDLTVWRQGDELELEIDAAQVEPLLAHFNRFIIMDDVELVPLGGEAAMRETALGLTGPAVHEILQRLGLPTLPQPLTSTAVEWNGINLRIERHYGLVAEHYALWAPESKISKLWLYLRAAGAIAAGSRSLHAFRIVEGIPGYGVDIVERDLPQETSQLRALNFTKGCYLGQEIVERIRSRGNVHRHLRQLELTGLLPAPGTELHLPGGAPAGQIRSAAELHLPSGSRLFALAMMRGEAEIGEQTFTYATEAATGTARLLDAPPVFQ